MNRTCQVCKNIFESNYPKKYCGENCRKVANRERNRIFVVSHYRTNITFREKMKNSIKEYQLKNPDKVKLWHRKSQKKIRRKYRERTWLSLSVEARKLLEKLAEEQQLLVIEKKKKYCEVCGWSPKEEKDYFKKKIVIHHISYIPIKTITLCTVCHAYLHHRLLSDKKVNKISETISK